MIITAFGISNIFSLVVNKKRIFSLILVIFGISYLWNISFYLHQYYVHYPKIYPSAWENGFSDLVNYVKVRKNNFEKVYVTNKYDQPYILFAFYLKYPPAEFQKQAKLTDRDQFGFSTVESFDNFVFGSINSEKISSPKSMIIGTPEEIPDSATIVKRIYFKDGKTEAFRIVEN
jgi:hypothetical protein